MKGFWTCIATCRHCQQELNRAVHVPEHEKGHVIISAPLMAICPVREHNTLSDCNIGVVLTWWEEVPGCSAPGCGYPDGKPCIHCGLIVPSRS